MKGARAAIVLLLGLVACDGNRDPNVLAYKRPLDMLAVALHDGEPCYVDVAVSPGGPAWPSSMRQFIGYDACYRFRQSEHFSGVWVDETEYSVFFEGAQVPPRAHFYGGDTHLIVSWGLGVKTNADDGKRHAFKIGFTGRKTAFSGPYSGLFRDVVIVDRIERLRLFAIRQ